ncbi:MAG: 30S ribosomal protein S19 [Candidatus Andersenbacteria bacterium]|nr:30S ribosomal protein S19 [bacterium]MDZ4225751.1 30S ribosomal protein S19 [Candidatus Andersenbacteria bacterium]
MSRSTKKGPYIEPKLLAKVKRLKAGDRTVIKTWARSSTIYPEMVGFRFGVHNGREHVEVLVVEEMVGHKLGEFSPTRKFVKHGGRIQKEAEMAAAAAAAIKPAADKPSLR